MNSYFKNHAVYALVAVAVTIIWIYEVWQDSYCRRWIVWYILEYTLFGPNILNTVVHRSC